MEQFEVQFDQAQYSSHGPDSLEQCLNQACLVIVGSGLYGLTIAEHVSRLNLGDVVVLERRSHPGGNAWSQREQTTGIEVHQYGSHLFHTSNVRIWDYVQQFTKFNDYRHFVVAKARGRVYPMPINLLTINSYFGTDWSPEEARRALGLAMDVKAPASNLEEKALALIGRELYETFVRGYTLKQWQTDPTQLPADIINRLPFRLDYRSGYFKDRFQGLPLAGYDGWISRMLNNPRIHLFLETDYFDVISAIPNLMPRVYTGPIDRYFGNRLGPLEWRTLDFQLEGVIVDDFQGAAVINYSDADVPWTRIHEFKHLHPERTHPGGRTVIMREFSRWADEQDEPYYPVNSAADKTRLAGYQALAARENGVHFGGRLGSYKYLDMHMAIGSAMHDFETQIAPMLSRRRA